MSMETVFDGPQLTPPVISLLTSAEIVPVEGDRWEQGFRMVNEGVESHGIFATTLCLTPENQTVNAWNAHLGGTELYEAIGLYSSESCSTWPNKLEFFDRAQRRLIASESAVLERQLWDGSIVVSPHLADSAAATNLTATTTVALTATAAKDAFAVIEQQLSQLSTTRGMIHMRPQVLHELCFAQVVRRVGNVWLSPMDNIVVPGRGYPGTGPAGQAIGATEWMYAHPGIVQIRRGPIVRLGENEPNSPTIVRTTNDKNVIVQRAVSVALDTSGGTLAIKFNRTS